MLKKISIFAICLIVAVLIVPMAYSQQPVPSEEQAAEEQVAPDKQVTPDQKVPAVIDAQKEPEAETVKIAGATSAAQAAIYVHGLNTYANPKVQFRLFTADNIYADKIEYRINDGEVKVYAEPFKIEQEGKYTISYNGVDKIGNREDANSLRIIIDATAPTIILSSNKPLMKQGDKIFIPTDLTFKVDSRDDISGVKSIEYSINGTDFLPYREPFGVPTTGAINLKVRAMDNVLNTQETYVLNLVDQSGNPVELRESALAMQIDNVPPVVEIKADKELLLKNNVKVASSDVKYAVTATDEASGVQTVFIRIDGRGDFIPYTGEVKFNTNGEHGIEAKAADKAGNMSPVSVFQVYVDVIPPTTNIETVTE